MKTKLLLNMNTNELQKSKWCESEERINEIGITGFKEEFW